MGTLEDQPFPRLDISAIEKHLYRDTGYAVINEFHRRPINQNQKDENMFGQSICHLCGNKMTKVKTVRTCSNYYGDKLERVFTYACGTKVRIYWSEDEGKEYDKETVVKQGKFCLKEPETEGVVK